MNTLSDKDEAEIIASREYLINGIDTQRKITIRIRQPRKRIQDDRYECVMELQEGDFLSIKAMNGVDAFDALLLSIMTLGVELGLFTEYTDGMLTWLNGQQSKLKFPTEPDYSLWSIHDK